MDGFFKFYLALSSLSGRKLQVQNKFTTLKRKSLDAESVIAFLVFLSHLVYLFSTIF